MLKNRIIRTTIQFKDGSEKVFLSNAGRINGVVTMRQDFIVKTFVNIGNSGLLTAKIDLFNLTDDTSKEIEQHASLVRLEAGWEGKTGVLFEGRSASITRTKPAVSSSDVVTSLYCISGLEVLQKNSFAETILNERLPSFLKRLASNFGLAASINSNIQGDIVDVAFNNDIVSILKDLSAEFNFDYYMTESTLFILDPSVIGGEKKYNPESGLLDIPIVTEKGIDLKVFLDPEISPGQGFDITSQFANFNVGNLNFLDRVRGQQVKTFGRQVNNNRYQGSYRALEIIHQGSSHTNSWESLISAQGLYNVSDIKNTERLSIS